MKRSFCFLLLPILVTSAGCPTTDNNVGSLGNDSAVAGGSSGGAPGSGGVTGGGGAVSGGSPAVPGGTSTASGGGSSGGGVTISGGAGRSGGVVTSGGASGGVVGTGGTTTTGGSAGATGGTIAPDGGGGSDGGGGIPENHRISHDTCGLSIQSTAPCVAYGTSGTEFSDCSASSNCQSGTNGRCLPETQMDGNSCNCAYDSCFSDGDCSAVGPCICGDGQVGNRCLGGNCQVDADCGPQGYCSPSRSLTAILQDRDLQSSWVGFYCHRSGDVCLNDADCSGGYEGGPYCGYDSTQGAWACMKYWVR